MHTLFYVSGQTVMALINMATLAVILGALAAIYTHDILTGLLVLAAAFISGTVGFGYSMWRLYRPRRGVLFRT